MRMKIAVAIATAGRPYVLFESLEDLAAQTRGPDIVAICPADQTKDISYDRNKLLGLNIHYSRGSRGASSQRNAIIRDVVGSDIILFMDDDFAMALDYVEECQKLFANHPDVVLATGSLLADDVNGPGLIATDARDMLNTSSKPSHEVLEDVFNGYGCNMAVRSSALRAVGARFDEALPLYSWGEDVDFSRQLSGQGRIVRSNMLRGVHRATKHGRTKGFNFGYSQIANQIYLIRKGTVPVLPALWQALRNIVANIGGSITGNPYIDRKGRLLGNAVGILDLLTGKSAPDRILRT